MRPIIKVEGVSKRYRIGPRAATTLRDAMTGAIKTPFRRLQRNADRETDAGNTVWALKDVSFDVYPGDVLGIVGNNGAGKSTLLKILSRVVEPTAGRVDLYGRVGSLLEVGTGFHPELSGRENVRLNGAILGMKRSEIDRKFDEIVAFSEIEKFIDTPVKWYSSGMYLRLAFSVAVHLEPEILIMDEVLAVGDAHFQQKCANKMQEVRKQGRTILFVSHDMAAITRMCNRAIYLSKGALLSDGSPKQIAKTYFGSTVKIAAQQEWPTFADAPGNDVVRLRSVRVVDEANQSIQVIDIRRAVGVEVVYDVVEKGYVLVPNCHFYNEQGICAFVTRDLDPEWCQKPRPVGQYKSTVWITGNFLSEGTLKVGVAISSTNEPLIVHLYKPEVVAFQVVDSLDGNSARGDYEGNMPGVVRPVLPWTTHLSATVSDARSTVTEEITL